MMAGCLGFRVSTYAHHDSYHAASLSLHSVLIIDTYIFKAESTLSEQSFSIASGWQFNFDSPGNTQRDDISTCCQ
jgi:hypothetical protein